MTNRIWAVVAVGVCLFLASSSCVRREVNNDTQSLGSTNYLTEILMAEHGQLTLLSKFMRDLRTEERVVREMYPQVEAEAKEVSKILDTDIEDASRVVMESYKSNPNSSVTKNLMNVLHAVNTRFQNLLEGVGEYRQYLSKLKMKAIGNAKAAEAVVQKESQELQLAMLVESEGRLRAQAARAMAKEKIAAIFKNADCVKAFATVLAPIAFTMIAAPVGYAIYSKSNSGSNIVNQARDGLPEGSPSPGAIYNDPRSAELLFDVAPQPPKNSIQMASILFAPEEDLLLMTSQMNTVKIGDTSVSYESIGRLTALHRLYCQNNTPLAEIISMLRDHLGAASTQLDNVAHMDAGLPLQLKTFKSNYSRVQREKTIFLNNVVVKDGAVKLVRKDGTVLANVVDCNDFETKFFANRLTLEAEQAF